VDLLLPRAHTRRRRMGRTDRHVERYSGRGVWVAFLGERLSISNWLGVAFIGAGAILVAYKG
jgi:hypothetical protein